MKKETTRKLQFLLVMAVFGCMGPLVRAIGLPPVVIACLRAWISALALILYVVLSGRKIDRAATKKVFLPMAVSGLLMAGDWIGLFNSYNYTTIAVSTVCYYMTPVIVFLASPFVLGERFKAKHAVCAAVSFVGMAFVSGVVRSGLPAVAELKGVFYALVGALSYAGVLLINKKYPEGDPIVRTAIQLAVTAVLTTPYVLLTENASDLHFSFLSVLLLLVLGILLTAVTYIIYFHLIVYLPARSVAIFSYADPVVAVFVSAVFLGEPLTAAGLFGSALIIGAAIVSEF